MTVTLVESPYSIFTAGNGSALSNGYVYIGQTGLNPQVNPISVFWDAELLYPAAQPIRTINGYASRDGSPGRLYVAESDYSILVKSSNGSLIYSALSVSLGASSEVAQFVKIDNVIDLRLYEPTEDYQQIELLGHTNPGIGGGRFYYDPVSADSDDNGVVIVTTGGNRWVRILEDDFVTLDMFGRVSTNVDSSFSYALDYVIANKTELRLPSGRSVLTSAVAKSITGYGSITISGHGENNSILDLNTGGDGLTLSLAGNYWLDVAPGSTGVHFKDFTISTTNASVGTGLSIVGSSEEGRPGPVVSFDNFNARGYNSFAHFWETGIKILDCADVYLNNIKVHVGGPAGAITATGVYIDGTAQANSPTNVHIDNPTFFYGGIQLKIGDFVEGVYITHPHMVGGYTAIDWQPSQGESGLHLMGGHISTKQKGLDLNNVFDVNVLGTLFYREGAETDYRGIHLRTVGRFNIGAGAIFVGTNVADGEYGVYVESSIDNIVYGGTILGEFHNFAESAIWLGDAANYVHVGDNLYRNCAKKVLNQTVNDNCTFAPRTYSLSKVVTLTGGAASEVYDLSLPAGAFRLKPSSCFAMATGYDDLIGFYDYDAPESTATNARFVLRTRDGTNVVANDYRISFLCFEDAYANEF